MVSHLEFRFGVPTTPDAFRPPLLAMLVFGGQSLLSDLLGGISISK